VRATLRYGADPRAPERTAAGVESRRRIVVTLVFVVYVLALLEGPLRKWFLPGLATPLYFLRDPVLLVLYAYALHHGFLTRVPLGRVWLLFAAVATTVGVIPFVLEGIDVRAYVLGARGYWIYLPLAFVVAASFTRADVERFLRWNVLLALPYAALVVWQYQSPPGAWINRAITGEEGVIRVAAGVVRPSGLFTFTGQNVAFVAFLVANYAAWLFVRERGRTATLTAAAGALAVGSLAVLTGSRGIYFLLAAILGLTLVGSTLALPTVRTLRRNALVLAAVVVAALLFTTVYGDMFAAMQRRVAVAAAIEGSIWARALDGVFAFVEPMVTAPVFGHGIATGTPAMSRFLDAAHLRYGESEMARVVNELGPLLGASFLALRWFTAAVLVAAAYRAARSGYPAALPLAGYAAVPIAIGQLTHSPLNAFQPWLIAGVVLAAAAVARRRPPGAGGTSEVAR
jgi:hypothetical protein